MPRIFTRRRGKSGLKLHEAITYKNQNGLPSIINNDVRQEIASGSYGTIYHIHNMNTVYKQHEIDIDNNRKTDACSEWEHEFLIHKSIYKTCNILMKQYDIGIARPYKFGYIKDIKNKSMIISNPENASACIYSMDYVSNGPKWNKFLLEPLRKNKNIGQINIQLDTIIYLESNE